MNLETALNQICKPDATAEQRCRKNWDLVAKPLGSLGFLEEATIKIAALTGDERYTLDSRAVLVFCADNGVVAQGVTQTDSSVTLAVAKSMARGTSSVCRMAEVADANVVPVDMGMCERPDFPGLIDRRVADGTRDISQGPAMTREQAETAILTGISLVGDLKEQGYKIIATGEMGIGNTTTSSAIVSALLQEPPAVVTGRGAGLSTAGLERKIQVVGQAIATNAPNPDDPLDVLARLGGFDIAAMTGAFLGGAIHSVPILVDGFVSSAAALVASRLAPLSIHAMLASHISAEPAGRMVLDALGLSPLICAGMRLGEGTGAVAALPLLDMAYAVYSQSSSFDALEIPRYQPQN